MGKTGEIKKPQAAAPAAEGGAPKQNAPQQNSNPSSKAKGAGEKVGCLAVGCKEKDKRHSFCDEHFSQFKFGLISKFGEKVLDYERKFEHYQNYLKSQKASRGKVA